MQSAFRRPARQAKAVLNLLLGGLACSCSGLASHQPDLGEGKSGRVLRRIGPWLPEHRIGRANLEAAFPGWPPSEIERVLGGVWDNLSRIGAEFVHLDRLWHVINAGTGEMDQVEFTPETIDRFVRLREDGKPALIFAAHLANWNCLRWPQTPSA